MGIIESNVTETAKNWLDPERRVVYRKIFVDEDLYTLEQERVFARTWLFIGHESQIQKPGDYFVSRMGEESVILTRDRQGEIHAFLNSCMHRGMKVCRYDEGNTPIFTCPYHGWSYGLSGDLVGVPYFKEAYHSELKKNEWGLKEVGQLCNYKGTIWATWDKTAPSFEEYLGGMAFHLDDLLDSRDGSPGGSEVVGGVQKWLTRANWKISAENRAGDLYHVISHRSVDLAGIGPSRGQGRRDAERHPFRGYSLLLENGHGMMTSEQTALHPATSQFREIPEVAEWFEHAYYERQKRLGDRARIGTGLGIGGNVFPNLSFWVHQPRRLFLINPGGSAKRSELWSWGLVDKDAPRAVKDVLRHYALRYAGPAGMTEQDDMENWDYATKASSGTMARRLPYNYQLGRGYEHAHPDMPGSAVERWSETNQFGMYSFWAELMVSDSWDELMEARKRRAKP